MKMGRWGRLGGGKAFCYLVWFGLFARRASGAVGFG